MGRLVREMDIAMLSQAGIRMASSIVMMQVLASEVIMHPVIIE